MSGAMTRCIRGALITALVLPLSWTAVWAQDKVEQIETLVQQYHDLRLFNGAVLVAEQGEVIYKKGFGYANVEWKIPNRPNTKFRIGSVTKQFTAAIVLQLAEEGKLSLEGKVVDYLPDYPKPAGEKVTIHHLLTHSSGIPNYTSLPDFFPEMSRDPYEPLEFLDVFSGLELEFEPGSEWSYSNSGYFLLGAIIEAVTGESYDQVLQSRILEPFGLHDTGYDRYDDIVERRASGYEVTFTGLENADYLDTTLPYAAGSLYSTVEDLYEWDQVLYTDGLFSDEHYKSLMFTPHIGGYGYGFFIRKVPLGAGEDSVSGIEHGGGINGFVTGFRRFVDDRHLIVLMDNTSSSVADLQRGISDILYGHTPSAPKRSIAQAIRETIEGDGVEAGVQRYHDLKRDNPDKYDFEEGELNRLGYYLLDKGDAAAAIAVFELNVEAYPRAFNTYDSLGEAFMKAGQKELAIENYQKSLELNPGNDNAIRMLAELGVEREATTEVMLAPQVLREYVGVYELQPDFTLTVTLEDGRLMMRATGQPKVEIFPVSETRFFLKVTDAQVEFNLGDGATVRSLTLLQAGREMEARKIE